MAAGGGTCMALSPLENSEPARKMAMIGAGIELAVIREVEGSDSIVAGRTTRGRACKLMQAARACPSAGLGLAVLAGRTRVG